MYILNERKTVSRKKLDEAIGLLDEPPKFGLVAGGYGGLDEVLFETRSKDTDTLRSFNVQTNIKKGIFPVHKPRLGVDKQRYADIFEASEAVSKGLDDRRISEEPEESVLLSASIEQPTSFDVDIENIIKERWRYLVMQFGGFFLTEIRPNKCFIGNKTLADELIVYDKKQGYGLNLQLLGNYLEQNSKGFAQIHLSDIMLNPKINDFDIFSITSGDVKKAGIFLDLARFLESYNKGKETVIPTHLPYYEKWKTSQTVREFGDLSENGKRDAVFGAEKVLRYLSEKWTTKRIKLALETGIDESGREGNRNYALIYEPHQLKFLIKGRENYLSICEDIGHLNIGNGEWTSYLPEEVSEFHVSGNNGREDQHTIATSSTLKDYSRIMSFLKFYSGNICAEIGKGELNNDEFIRGIKNLAYAFFSEPNKIDFENMIEIENRVFKITKEKISSKNLNKERYEKYLDYRKINQV